MSELKIKKGYAIGIDGKEEEHILKVGDGSIITRFDKTPIPKESTDVVCPHFLEFKWGYGCSYSCSWCYLQGTYRWPQFKKHGSNISPTIKNKEKIEDHLQAIGQNGNKELLNAGELADSLMLNWLPEFLLDKDLNGNKILFLTKSDQVDFLIKNKLKLRKKIVMSFTLNAYPVSKRWEKGAPDSSERIKAAEKVTEAGYKIRIRIDPMVPIKGWEMHYTNLIDDIFEKFEPDRITLGSLRGLQSTINTSKDKSWTPYMKERSNWGRKIDFNTRYEMYSTIINYLKEKYNYSNVALCKETLEIWENLDLNYKSIKCNCVI